jgi:hypothetical protein
MRWYRKLNAHRDTRWALAVTWTGMALAVFGLGGWTGWALAVAWVPAVIDCRAIRLELTHA